jgi:hypothetical protein
VKPRKPIPYKLKATLQKEIGSVCPFCTNKDVQHFEIHHIDEKPENNEASNLLMLCPTCHSKITKGDIKLKEVIDTKIKFSKPKREIPKELKDLAEEAWENRNNAFYKKAFEQVEIGIAKSKLLDDEYSEAYFNSILATILHEKYQRTDEAIAIKLNCI